MNKEDEIGGLGGEYGDDGAGRTVCAEEFEEGAGVCGSGGDHAGTGDWGVNGDLQRDGEHPDGAVSVPGCGAVHVHADS